MVVETGWSVKYGRCGLTGSGTILISDSSYEVACTFCFRQPEVGLLGFSIPGGTTAYGGRNVYGAGGQDSDGEVAESTLRRLLDEKSSLVLGLLCEAFW